MWGKNELRSERSFVLDHFMNTFGARTDLVVNTGQHGLRQTNHIFKGKDNDNGMSILRYFIKQSLKGSSTKKISIAQISHFG